MSSHANSPSLLTLSFPEQKPSKISVTQRCKFIAERNGTVVEDRRLPSASPNPPAATWPVAAARGCRRALLCRS